MRPEKIDVWEGQHGLGGQFQNLIFSCKSDLTIIFRALNNLRNKSYINLYKSCKGCKNQSLESLVVALLT
jgi:hypothetical protein